MRDKAEAEIEPQPRAADVTLALIHWIGWGLLTHKWRALNQTKEEYERYKAETPSSTIVAHHSI